MAHLEKRRKYLSIILLIRDVAFADIDNDGIRFCFLQKEISTDCTEMITQETTDG